MRSSSGTLLRAVMRSFRSIAPENTCVSSTTKSVEMLSFSSACRTSSFIACLIVMPSRRMMQFVVMRLPISSSSNEAISFSSVRTSGSTMSMMSVRFSLSSSRSTSTAVSVSSREMMSAALRMSISPR